MAIRSAARRSPRPASRAEEPGGRQSGLASRAARDGQAGSGAHIPAAEASFLGRAGEVEELSRLLEGERLVTLTGAPGIGKTRLALELASTLRSGYPGDACVVELASVARPAHVSRAVASALSIDEQPGQVLVETIVARLACRRLLLVLDNCEHVLGGCAKLVGALLAGCSRLSILTTSREALGVSGERVWEVPALLVPDEAEDEPEVLAGNAAVGVFVQRARAVQPDFSLNAYVAPAVVEIVRRLDGIPLAIELAAGRVASLTVAEIAGRLSDRFALLGKGTGGQPARHQTLQAALDWSYELLTDPERALLRRLSVFAGAFDAEAARAVCAGGEIEVGQAGELLAGLASKSLVVAEANGSPAMRHRLLETVRVYAAERLEQAGERAELRGAHARFYLVLAERAEPELTGAHQEQWFTRLEVERPNLRSAIEWSLSHGDTEQALRLAGALVLFWRVRCHFSEGRELLDAAVAVSDATPVGLRARALWGAGFMAHLTGDNDAAVALLEQSLSLYGELEDRQGCARALMVLGNCLLLRGDPRGLSLLEQSATEARVVGDAWCLGHALALPAFRYLAVVGELTVARGLFEECLQVARAAEDAQSLRIGLLGLGAVALRQGDFALAESLLEEALVVTGRLGEDYTRAWSLHYLGKLSLGRGDPARARELLDEAVALARQIGSLHIVASSLVPLGRVARARGDRPGARRLFEQVRDMASAESCAGPLQELGELAAEEDEPEAARRLFEEALRLARARGDKQLTADALFALGELARSVGERRRATVLHDEALELRQTMGSAPEVVASLEAFAGLAAHEGRCDRAARLLGAAQRVREQNGYARLPWVSSSCEADLALVREALSEQALEDALAKGARLSLREAAAEASSRGNGWSSLTESERQVASLVCGGLTNAQIAERRFISLTTVKRRLAVVFAKLGVEGRTELAREVRRRSHDHAGSAE